MADEFWQWTLSIIFAGAIVLLIVSLLLLRFTLDRRIRRALPKDKIYDSIYDECFGFGRAVIFGWASVASHFNNSPKLRLAYDNFDVKSFANHFEKLMGYCMAVSLIAALISGFSVYITDWLGIFEWN